MKLRLNILWLGLWLCLTGSQATEYYAMKHYSIADGMSQNTVMSILQDKQGYMWFGTWDGLNRFNGYSFQVYKATKDGELAQVNNRVDFIYEDKSEQIWWQTNDNHFYMMDRARKQIQEKRMEELPAEMKKQMAVTDDSIRIDSRGIIWRTDNQEGILRLRDGKWKRFVPQVDARYAGQLREHLIVLEDPFGRTWVNPTGGGWSYYDYQTDQLVNPLKTITNMIHTAYIDNDGQMWISTYDGGVECINMTPQPYDIHDMRQSTSDNGEVRAFLETADGEIHTFCKDSRRIYCAAKTSYGILYGTKGQGLVSESGEVLPTTHKDIYDIEERAGKLYIATYGGGVNILSRNAQNTGWGNPKIVGKGLKVRDLIIVDDAVWCATTTGVLRIGIRDYRTKMIPSFDTRCLCYSNHRIWAGTFGGGLFYIDPKDTACTMHSVETRKNIVLSIAGNDQYVWFTSEDDITQLNLQTMRCRYYAALDDEECTYFTEAEALLSSDGIIYFGCSNGYCSFDPRKVKSSGQAPLMKIIQCTSEGQNLDISEGIEIEEGARLTIEYAALDYVDNHNIIYMYQLEGVDTDWDTTYDQRKVTYNNLHSGNYRFRVRSTNHEGEDVDNEIVLNIRVKTPMWRSWWAWIIYGLLIIGVLVLTFYAVWTFNKMRQKMTVEQQVTDIKLRFFTNISHELRTPLTLISGPVNNILTNERISNSVREQLEIVQSNSMRMLRMVNQLLDFRKIQNKKMRLKVQQSLLSELVKETCANFNKEAYDKKIAFSIDIRAKDSTVWIDRSKMDTVIFNLLSNAFKFTPSGKSVKVIVDEKPEFILLKIQDEGVGIPMEKRSLLFERFSSNNELSGQNTNTGTGIGLNLVKELIDLHHGYIEVESEVGRGTCFTIMLHTGREHFGNEVDVVADDKTTIAAEMPPKETLHELPNMLSASRMVLVVDDNEDMRQFLSSILSSDYRVVTAQDGKEAMDKMQEELPDLVVSDLMMPNMDGLELTDRIKKSDDMGHVPVILLTAKSAIESRLEAMQNGADDYVTKPFEPTYLKARIRNILKQREQLEKTYRNRLLKLEPQNDSEQSQADTFLAKLMNTMNKHMENCDLTVDDLVDEMGLGRTVFFNKLKGLTGMNPVEFIREVRIKRAAQLLENGHQNIAEVSYMVGISDSRYFAKCFKAAFGTTPTAYRKQHAKTEK